MVLGVVRLDCTVCSWLKYRIKVNDDIDRYSETINLLLMRHVFNFMVKSVENGMEAEIGGLVMVFRFLVAMRIWLGDS
jgi:hypothetical protein